ncbi:MAG TPA: FeoB-associated Cys-rich membrane protein [Feifaniaceae bacterium]|nr:FeoB-associated Cys-rich membrane protein [Feifaniaceae bacterium]
MLSTIIISVVLAGIVALVIRNMVKKRKQAKETGGCAGCPGCSSGSSRCH